MKISGKFILKVAGTLTVISLVVAALLGLVDNVTADKIAAIDAENTRIAMSAVAPEGSEFGDKLDITDDMTAAAASQGGKLVELYPMTTAGADNGYVMKISASGSQGSIVMMVGVDADKAITGISVVSHAETSGIGTKVVGNEPNAAGEPQRFVDFSAPILSGDKTIGVLALHGSWDWTREVIEGLLPPNASARGLELFIFDHSGQVIYAPPRASRRLPSQRPAPTSAAQRQRCATSRYSDLARRPALPDRQRGAAGARASG